MKRALFIGGGTLAGVAAVLSYVPINFSSSSTNALSVPTSSGASTPSTATASTPATPTQAPSQAPTSSQAPTPTNPPAAAPVSKTATGAIYSACGYGNVQVRIAVVNGVVTKVDALSYPNGDPRSQFINQQAIPWLQQQTLAAKNSSQIAGVGGATCTTGAWTSSLQSALTAAGL